MLLPLLEERSFYLIRLARRNIVRQAVSWLRAAHMANIRNNLWSIPKGAEGLGPIRIDPDTLVNTIAWLGTARASHDVAYDAYRGKKMTVYYEDVLGADPAPMAELLAFLGVDTHTLVPFYERLTQPDLSCSVTNYAEIVERLDRWGMGQCLTDVA
jgi:hypothetical protein